MANKVSHEVESEAIALYEQGHSLATVGEKLNINSKTVKRILVDSNIPLRGKSHHNQSNKFSEEKELEIVEAYLEGMNTNEIAKEQGTYNTSIRRVLLRRGITLRTNSEAHRVVSLQDFTSREGSEDFDYFLGLLATDGCITGNRVVLDFSEENKELLHYWNEFLGNKCNITCSIHKVFKVPQYRIAFRNQEICNYLGSFGIVPNKTLSLQLKYINWDVLRGIIDGDGCISWSNNGTTVRVSITSGCREFLEQIQAFYEKYGITSYLNESSRNIHPTYDLLVYNTIDVLKIYENLYSNAHFFLKRKKEKFGPVIGKPITQHSVNSGKEKCNYNPEPSLNLEEGVETLNGTPKEE